MGTRASRRPSSSPCCKVWARSIAPLAAVVLLGASGPAVADDPDRSAEVAEILRNLAHVHPNGLTVQADPEYQAFAGKLLSEADDLDLTVYVRHLHELFSFFRDGHTAVLSINMNSEPYRLRLPLRVDLFADGIYVTEAKDEAIAILGGRIVSVSGVPIDEVLRRYVAGMHGANSAWAMRWSPFLFAFPGWLHGLGIVSGDYAAPISVEVELANGATVSVDLLPREGANENRRAVDKVPTPAQRMWLENGGPNFVRPVEDGSAIYVSMDRMQDLEGKTFADFASEILEAMALPSAERLVVDLRRNGGGNNMLPERLRRAIAQSRFNRRGALYVLIGPRTFSAAMNFATRLERETEALFVGQPTGAAPNHYGDAKRFVGPSTGIEYLVSSVRWQDSAPFDQRIWILPDLPTIAEIGDYLSGNDPALNAALTYQPQPAGDAPGSFVGKPWMRSSQSRGWKFFFESDGQRKTGPPAR